MAIFEMLVINDDIRNLTLSKVDSSKIKRMGLEHGMTTLRMDGADKIIRGLTSVDEVMRVTEDENVAIAD